MIKYKLKVIVFVIVTVILLVIVTVTINNTDCFISPSQATHELSSGCTLEYDNEEDILFIIVDDYKKKDFYKYIGVLEDHYNRIVVVHASQYRK